MKNVKRIALLAIVTLTALEAGCFMLMDKGVTNDELMKQMDEHLTAKYGRLDYNVLSLYRAGFEYGFDRLYAYVRDGDKDLDGFEVERYKNEEGNGYYFLDNYFYLLIKDEYEKYITTLANKEFVECKAYYFVHRMPPNDLTSKTSLVDALKSGGLDNAMVIFIVNEKYFIEETDIALRANQFVQSWHALGYGRIVLRILLVTKEDFDKSCRSNIIDYLGAPFVILEVEEKLIND